MIFRKRGIELIGAIRDVIFDGSFPSIGHKKIAGLRINEIFKALMIAAFGAFFIITFLFEAFKIPTASMQNTLLPGDFLLVNKAIYGPATPKYIPLTSIALPSFALPSIREPERNDVIVFEFPGEQDEIKPKERTYFIKRCAATPGDKLEIRQGRVYVNDSPIKPDLIEAGWQVKKCPANPNIFPKGRQWDKFNYGPIVIPHRGQKIWLTDENLSIYAGLINKEYGRNVVSAAGKDIFIDGKKALDYTIKKDYYFMLGDNRNNSRDSRFWGFVPRENIIGKAMLIYWSIEDNPGSGGMTGFLSSIRFSRIARLIE